MRVTTFFLFTILFGLIYVQYDRDRQMGDHQMGEQMDHEELLDHMQTIDGRPATQTAHAFSYLKNAGDAGK